jgi:hypothetical protein
MLDEMGSNMLVVISGGCGPNNCEFKFTFDCSIAISPVCIPKLLLVAAGIGNLAVKEGILSVVHNKSSPIRNIHVWTSAFMVYASVMLEKWPKKGLAFLKYMQTVVVGLKTVNLNLHLIVLLQSLLFE